MASLREAQERYARYYLRLAERAEPALRGADQAAWLDRLELEHDHVRAVLRWAQEAGEQEAGLRVAGAVCGFWYVRGYLSEGRNWLEGLLRRGRVPEASSGGAAVRAKALSGAGVLAGRQGDYARATELHQECLALRRELGDRWGIAASLNNLGSVAYAQGDYTRATTLCEECLALYRELSNTQGVANALNNLGAVAHDRGDYTRATALHEESLALYRVVSDKGGIAASLNNLGLVAQEQGDYARALATHEESLTLRRELGDKRGIATSLNNLGLVACARGDHARAVVLHEECLALRRELGDKAGVATSLHNLGAVAQEQGDYALATALQVKSLVLRHELGDKRGIAYCLEGLARVVAAPGAAPGVLERAARLLGSAAALREAIRAPLAPNERATYDRTVAVLRAALGDAAFDAASAAGQALTLEQALAVALGESSPAL